jgi:hypothetical protein
MTTSAPKTHYIHVFDIGSIMEDEQTYNLRSPIMHSCVKYMNSVIRSEDKFVGMLYNSYADGTMLDGINKALQYTEPLPADTRSVIILQANNNTGTTSDKLFEILQSSLTLRTTIHTIGYGNASSVDISLLSRIAYLGKGTVNHITEDSKAHTIFSQLMTTLAQPVMSA